MELYKEYVKEREGCEILILEDGFISVRVDTDETQNKYLFINDIFVSKKNRTRIRHTAIRLFNAAKEAALKQNCLRMRGIVWTNTLNVSESLKACLYYGFKIVGAEHNQIYVESDLNIPSSIKTPPFRGVNKPDAKK